MQLSNTYWCIRHGHSLANAQDIIVSSLDKGIDPCWALSDLGRNQADGVAGRHLLSLLGTTNDPSKLIVCTSPFSRCLETAERVAAGLGVAPSDACFRQVDNLRERFFGEYELQSTDNYEKVWADDGISIENKPPGWFLFFFNNKNT